MPKILIVEDDPQIAKSLAMNLKFSGYETSSATTINDAWEILRKEHFDLMCLDIGLPDGSGLDLCQKIRDEGNDIPVLFLSARTDEATVVKGINCGADDYLRKPFGIEELKVRMNKILKKFIIPTSIITFGNLTIDPAKRIVTIMDKIVTLGRKELEILILLTKRAGDIVTRENILTALYENADMYDRTVDSHMSHLRRKLREVAGPALQINSVYGLGYRLEWKN
ncbi:MAG: response regulator transcription factor [Bdellovibrionales bacterium]|nr:response regulator transcription factor [Bdellovibrionales bacterium]